MTPEQEFFHRAAEVFGFTAAGGLIAFVAFIGGVAATVSHFNVWADLSAKLRGQRQADKVNE